MAKRLEREFGRFDVAFTDSAEYLNMRPGMRAHAYLYLLALTGWSRMHRTDGLVVQKVARELGQRMGRDYKKLLRSLEEVSMISMRNDDVFITKYSKWQETREEIEAHKRANREYQKRHRQKLVSPDSGLSQVTEREIEKEREIINASVRDKALRVDAVKNRDDPGLQLAVLMEPLLGHALSAVDIQNCGAALQQFEYLTGIPHFVKRAGEHNTVCQVKSWPKPRTIEGYFESWRLENEYMADRGNLKPRTRAGITQGLTKLNLGDLVHLKDAQ